MKHFKSALALILTVSVIGTALPSLAFEDTAEENTEVFSYPADDIYDDEITDTSFMAEDMPIEAEEAATFADSYTEAPGYQTDPDTGESTIDENGYITNTYGYSMHSDPFNSKQVLEGKEYSAGSKHLHDPYWLKDENFFGKWNSDTESWEIKGKLDDDNYAGLSDVEMCVKDGNYEDAKLALYNYYIIVERGRDRKKDISTAKKDKITADLLLKNFMYNANSGISPLELLYINNTPKYHSADITDTVKKYIGTRQNLSFWAIATDKNGDKAIFNSKEAGEETSPYLLVKVNGTERIIYPSDDTNIKAGSNSSKAFGSEETLTACEDAINSPNTLVNENTSRVYMKFDMSWLKTGDTVTAATLNLYGHNEKENAEKEVVILTGMKKHQPTKAYLRR